MGMSKGRFIYFTVGTAVALVGSGVLVDRNASPGSRGDLSIGMTTECASIARIVAGRNNHAILDGRPTRDMVRQIYEVCMSDPAALRRMVR